MFVFTVVTVVISTLWPMLLDLGFLMFATNTHTQHVLVLNGKKLTTASARQLFYSPLYNVNFNITCFVWRCTSTPIPTTCVCICNKHLVCELWTNGCTAILISIDQCIYVPDDSRDITSMFGSIDTSLMAHSTHDMLTNAWYTVCITV